MDYGFAFLSAPDIDKDIAFAESKGFTHAWLYESQMVCADVFQCLALCAVATKSIKLGTNVINPHSRIAPVTACNYATLNQLAPGRVIMGIGTGNTARRTLGMPAARLSALREHVEICRGLMSGGTVDYQEGERKRKIRFLNPDGGWINVKDRIPIFIAANGPKTLELAGEIADGIILFGAVGDSLLEYALGHVRKGAERSGRSLDDLYLMVTTTSHVAKEGETLAEKQKAVGAYVASECNIFSLSVKDPNELPADVRDEIMAFKTAFRTPDAPIETRHLELYKGYVNDFNPAHSPLITEKMIKETSLTGTPAEICDRVRKLAKAGIKQIAIHGNNRAEVRRVMAEFSDNVIAKM